MGISSLITLINMTMFCLAWSPTGHFIIAAIAQKELEITNKEILNKAVTLLEFLSDFTHKGKYPFIDASIYADDIKDAMWLSFRSRHFYNKYFELSPTRGVIYPNIPGDHNHIIRGIDDAVDTLKAPTHGRIDNRLGKSLELRFLIHYIGDIHQPLHTISQISANHEKGDQGGNLFAITGTKSTNLHAFWDSLFDEPSWIYKRAPITDHAYSVIQKEAERLMKTFPRRKLARIETNKLYSDWLRESYSLAINKAYDGIKEGKKPSNDYIEKNRPIAEEQLAVAGYRLADVLVDALGMLEIEATKPIKLVEEKPKTVTMSTQTELEPIIAEKSDPMIVSQTQGTKTIRNSKKFLREEDFNDDLSINMMLPPKGLGSEPIMGTKKKFPQKSMKTFVSLEKILQEKSPNIQPLVSSPIIRDENLAPAVIKGKKKKLKNKTKALLLDETKFENNKLVSLIQEPEEFLSDSEEPKPHSNPHASFPVIEIADDPAILQEFITDETEKEYDSAPVIPQENTEATGKSTGLVAYIKSFFSNLYNFNSAGHDSYKNDKGEFDYLIRI